MGIDFFRKAVELQDKYRRSGMTIRNSLQTNATIINDEWAIFFKENNFLIGISIDGPPKLHDHYRFDKKGDPSSADVIRGLRLFQKHEVDYNILCVVNNYNGDYPVQIYNYFKDLGAQFMQFIPIVEHFGDGSEVSPRSINPKQYGRFLCAVLMNGSKKILARSSSRSLMSLWKLGSDSNQAYAYSMKHAGMQWQWNIMGTYMHATIMSHQNT